MNIRGIVALALALFIPAIVISAVFGAGDATIVIEGGTSNSAGLAIAIVGDVNDDTYPDFVVSAPGATTANGSDSGIVFVVFGGSGIASSIDLSSLGVGEATEILGPAADAALSGAVSSAGDFNDDGIPDILISSSSSDYSTRTGAGVAYVIFGNATLPSSIDTASLGSGGIEIGGSAAGAALGTCVAYAGDFNDDGIDDIVLGAPGTGSGGEVYVIYGSSTPADIDTATLGSAGISYAAAASGDDLGASCAGAGDFDDDGIPDILVGAPLNGSGDAGAAFVIFGSASPSSVDLNALTTASDGAIEINGGADGDELGRSCAGIGDFNDDGVDDILLGTPAAAEGDGEAYVVYGTGSPTTPIDISAIATDGLTIEAENSDDGLGAAVAGIGDFSGDGIADIAVSALGYDGSTLTDSGIVYVITGSDDPPTLITGTDLGTIEHAFEGEASSALFGTSIAGGEDVDDDASIDLLVGAPADEPSSRVAAGSVFVFAAPPFITSPQVTMTVCDGDSVTFTVSATGAGTLTYQWRVDEVNIIGATDSSYTIDPVGVLDVGDYDVTVTGTGGSTMSALATLELGTTASAISDLVCEVGEEDCVTSEVSLSWTNNDIYDGIDIIRDGELLATLFGLSESFLDTTASEVDHVYELVALSTGLDCSEVLTASESCTGVNAYESEFLRGDLNQDGRDDIADPIFGIRYLFSKGRVPTCLDAADANDDGRVDLADPIYMLKFLFIGGERPDAPYPDHGLDDTCDPLDCKP